MRFNSPFANVWLALLDVIAKYHVIGGRVPQRMTPKTLGRDGVAKIELTTIIRRSNISVENVFPE
jgi:hypothetical protein